MPPLKSDKDLLDALDLSEGEAAEVIGRSRQSLYQAGLKSQSKYFKKADLVSLVIEGRKRDPKLDLAPIERYIAETREPDQIPDLQLFASPEVDEGILRKYEDLWIIIPDFGTLKRRYTETVDLLMRLCLGTEGADERRVIIYTAGPLNKKLIDQRLEKAAEADPLGRSAIAEVCAEDWIAAIPFLILGNPQKEADSFVMTEGRYVPNDWEGAAMLVLLIEKLAAEKRPVPEVV